MNNQKIPTWYARRITESMQQIVYHATQSISPVMDDTICNRLEDTINKFLIDCRISHRLADHIIMYANSEPEPEPEIETKRMHWLNMAYVECLSSKFAYCLNTELQGDDISHWRPSKRLWICYLANGFSLSIKESRFLINMSFQKESIK